MKRELIILGAIGNTARQNRDDMRILGRGGIIYTLKSHIDKDHPLVLKKFKKQEHLTAINGDKYWNDTE